MGHNTLHGTKKHLIASGALFVHSYPYASNKIILPVKTIVYLIPLLVAAQATIFGSLGFSQIAGTFPIITIGQFRIRVEELIILLFFFAFLLGLSTIPKYRSNYHNNGKSKIGWALALYIFGMAQASIQGFLKNSPHNLTDTRLFFIPLLYFFFALYSIRFIRLAHLSNFVLYSLLPMALLLQLSVFISVENEMNKVAHIFGGVYGGFSPPLALLIMSCLSIVFLRFIYSRKNRLIYFLLSVFLVAGLLSRIYKPGWVGVASIFIISAFVLVHNNKKMRIHHFSRNRIISAYIVLLFVIFLFMLYAQVYKPNLIADYKQEAINRIMRHDAGGDFTGNRLKMLEGAIIEIKRAPIIGLGTGWWYEFRVQDGEIRNIPDHLILSWVVTRGGMITLIPLIILIYWYIKKGFMNCQNMKNGDLKPFVVACYVSTLMMLIYSLLGDYYSFFEQQIFFWLFVAVVLVAPSHPDNIMVSSRIGVRASHLPMSFTQRKKIFQKSDE